MTPLLILLALFAAYFAPAAAQGDCATPRLEIGEQARVTPGAPNRVRDAASTSGNLIGEIPGGATFDVLDGPFCDGGLLWWQVSYGELTGFTAEGNRDTYFVEPVSANQATAIPASDPAGCPFESRLRAGGLAYVNSTTPLRMRDQPSTQGREIRQIQNDQAMQVLEGPVCAEGYAWWQVTYKEATGWTVEGSADGFFLDPLEPTATPPPTSTPIPAATAVPTMTPTPRPPSLEYVLDLDWSSDGEMIVVRDALGIATFDTSDFGAAGVRVLDSAFTDWSEIALDPANEGGLYLISYNTVGYIEIGSDEIAYLSFADTLSDFTLTADGLFYGFIGQYESGTKSAELYAGRTGSEEVLSVYGMFDWDMPYALALSPDGSMLALWQSDVPFEGHTDGIQVWPADGHSDISFVTFLERPIEGLAETDNLLFAHDSSFLISRSPRGDLERWLPDGERAAAFIRAKGDSGARTYDLALSPDNQRLAATEVDNDSSRPALRVYNTESLTQVGAYGSEINAAGIRGLAYSPDGKHIAVGVDNAVHILDAGTLELVAVLEWTTP